MMVKPVAINSVHDGSLRFTSGRYEFSVALIEAGEVGIVRKIVKLAVCFAQFDTLDALWCAIEDNLKETIPDARLPPGIQVT